MNLPHRFLSFHSLAFASLWRDKTILRYTCTHCTIFHWILFILCVCVYVSRCYKNFFRPRQFTILQAHIFLNTFDFILLTCKPPFFPFFMCMYGSSVCVCRDFSFSFNLASERWKCVQTNARIKRVNFSF